MFTHIFMYNNGLASKHTFESDTVAYDAAVRELNTMRLLSRDYKAVAVWRNTNPHGRPRYTHVATIC